MVQSELDKLLDQLATKNSDPRAQKGIIRRLAKLGDPAAITDLTNLYAKVDADPGVRKAAAEALRVFRQMEQHIVGSAMNGRDASSQNNEDTESVPVSSGLLDLLKRARLGLAGLLVVTLLANGALIVVHSLPPPATPTQAEATSRDVLTTALKSRIQDTRADATTLRQRWQELQSNVALSCPGKFSSVAKVDLAAIDLRTYPDLQALNDTLNQATQKVALLRNNWDGICTNPKDKETLTRFAGPNGAAGRITEVDDALKTLDAAQSAFDQWVKNPAATIGPSATPITPSPVPPTITLTPTAGPSATNTLPPTAVIVVTAPPTPLPTITFDGAKLATLNSYTYKLSVRYEGTRGTGGSFSGSLTVTALRSAKPLNAQSNAQLDINLSEDEKLLSTVNPFFVKGRTLYQQLGGKYYVDVSTPPGTPCKIAAATDKSAAALETITPDIFLKFGNQQLTRVPKDEQINGVLAQHYHTEGKSGDGKNVVSTAYDVYLSADKQLPVRVAYAVSGPYTGLAGLAAGNRLSLFSVTYDLTQINPDVGKMSAPQGCPTK